MASEKKGATGLAGRYAVALFDLADVEGLLDRVATDLKALQAMIDDSADLRRVVRSPAISRHDQVKAMTALAEKAGMSALTGRFLGLVASNRRLFALPAMIRAYLGVLAARNGETAAEVVSAKALTAKQLEGLTAALSGAVGTTVMIEARVDPAVLGGLMVKVGSRMVDSTLRAKLQHLRLAMKGIG